MGAWGQELRPLVLPPGENPSLPRVRGFTSDWGVTSSLLTSLSYIIMQQIACGAAFGCILAKVFLHQSPRKSRAPTSATLMPLACP